jgi:hypothetical protein
MVSMNLGRPRQIVHGQMIHRSVLQRFQHHRPAAPHTDAEPGVIRVGPRTIIGPDAPVSQANAQARTDEPESTFPVIEISVSPAIDDVVDAPQPTSDGYASPLSSTATLGARPSKTPGPPTGREIYWAPKALLPVEWRTSWDGLRDESGGPTVVWEF